MHSERREFPNDVAELRRLSQWIHAYAARVPVAGNVLDRVDLCLQEAVANVMLYGYENGAHGTIAVSLEPIDSGLRVTVEDDGRAFDPLSHPPPRQTFTIEDAPEGGFGIHLMRSSSDGLEYSREHQRNIVVMRFRPR